MRERKLISLVAIGMVAFVLLWCSSVFADKWELPRLGKYYSANKMYYLEIIPRQLESAVKYFHEMAQGKKDAGSPEGLVDNYCKGTLYKLDADKGYQQEWSQPLVNDVFPAGALVSNAGEYVVTFDNWHSVGYGDNVVVIYDSQGQLIKKFSLEDILSKETITKICVTVSSRWWGGDHYLDEERGLLILKVITNGKMPGDRDADFKEVRIDLANGNLIAAETSAPTD